MAHRVVERLGRSATLSSPPTAGALTFVDDVPTRAESGSGTAYDVLAVRVRPTTSSSVGQAGAQVERVAFLVAMLALAEQGDPGDPDPDPGEVPVPLAGWSINDGVDDYRVDRVTAIGDRSVYRLECSRSAGGES